MERSALNARLRQLPSVDEVLRSDAVAALHGRAPRWAIVEAVRAEVERLRGQLRDAAGAADPSPTPTLPSAESIARGVAARLRPSLERVLNATGVVLHTNLGRAPLGGAAIAAITEVARGYANLEYDLEKGARGSRHVHASDLLCELTGAEAALVVNNNAAAVLLALDGIAAGREVVVSRGELVEIGGAFRVPDVMSASGARLVEVGTTNRTHLGDYQRAIGPGTAALLKVHRSNFAIVGFTAEVDVADLASLAHERGVLALVDLGSGCFVDLAAAGLPPEPTVRETVRAGADLVLFSGDKLLGGPQAGLLVGREAVVGRLRQRPLLRALRPDKLTLAGLAATLALYRDGRAEEVPIVRMLLSSTATLAARAAGLESLVREQVPAASLEIVSVESAVGGGALPLATPRSSALALAPPEGTSIETLERRLRHATPPVIGRVSDGRLLFDVRTLRDDELPLVARAIAEGFAPPSSSDTP